MIVYDQVHPLTIALKAIAPILGLNFDIVSARDSELEPTKYPRLEYVVHREASQVYDRANRSWRIELVVQLDIQLEETKVAICTQQDELDESQAIQGIQYSVTSNIRSILQLLVNPGSLGSEFNEEHFIWSKYQFKLVSVPQSQYFRDQSADRVTGASTLLIVSLLNIDNNICCTKDNESAILEALIDDSISKRKLEAKI